MDEQLIIRDNFDRFVAWATKCPLLYWFKPSYIHHKEFWLYALFGAGTIFCSVASYDLFSEKFGWNILLANALSWIAATTFAFLTNRKWVFTSHPKGLFAFFIQMSGFYFGRILTLGLEEWMLWFFVTVQDFDNMLVKYLAQIVVIAVNYVFSKLVVFRQHGRRSGRGKKQH